MATPDPEALDNAAAAAVSAAAADAEPQGRTAYRTQADALFRKNLTYQVLTTQPNSHSIACQLSNVPCQCNKPRIEENVKNVKNVNEE
jgi:hypothetical protein